MYRKITVPRMIYSASGLNPSLSAHSSLAAMATLLQYLNVFQHVDLFRACCIVSNRALQNDMNVPSNKQREERSKISTIAIYP